MPAITQPHTLWDTYQEGSRFFMQEGNVFDTLRRLAQRLRDEGLDYALIGGMALAAHGYRRFTEDVDILMTPAGLPAFRERMVGSGYVPAFKGATKSFRDMETGVCLKVFPTGECVGGNTPKPAAFSDPKQARFERDGLWLITLEKLIELKLTSGLSALHRLKDLADVQDLIMRLQLPLDFATKLDASVQAEYRRLWESVQVANNEQG